MEKVKVTRRDMRTLERALDKSTTRSIQTIKSELKFLNAAGNPKYRLVVQSDFRWKASKFLSRMAFWR